MKGVNFILEDRNDPFQNPDDRTAVSSNARNGNRNAT